MVRGNPRVAKEVQHIPEQGAKTGAVQPITTEPSVRSEGGVGVVVHLSKTREKRIKISSIEQKQQTKTPNEPRRQ
jgi:ATP adenylyltransferase/5',5'''-P-1,P-4-tetraphosphate phosphorylase II